MRFSQLGYGVCRLDSHASVPVTLWDVQNICYPALVNAFEEKGRGVGGDPAMQNHFDNLVHLAEQLRIRAPQLEQP